MIHINVISIKIIVRMISKGISRTFAECCNPAWIEPDGVRGPGHPASIRNSYEGRT